MISSGCLDGERGEVVVVLGVGANVVLVHMYPLDVVVEYMIEHVRPPDVMRICV